MDLENFYCAKARINDWESIQYDLQNFILKNIDIFDERWIGFKTIKNDLLISLCPNLKNFLNLSGLRLHHAAINNMTPGMKQNIHCDWIPKNTSDIALLFEIQNCQDTETTVFRIKQGRENNGKSHDTPVPNTEESDYVLWDADDVEPVKTYNLKTPVLVKISQPHQAENFSSNTTEHRICITLRFFNNPLEKIQWYD
jgi:hypothetical protein